MGNASKAGVVLGGYALAVAIAFAAEHAYIAATPGVDRRLYAGMSAFGDGMVFAGALALAALAPTAAALWFLRAWRPLWAALSVLAVASALMGLVAILPWVLRGPDAARGTWLQVWVGLAPIRALAAPLFALAAAVAAVIAPSREFRIVLGVVAIGELAGFVLAIAHLFAR
jgi:hypothetical protein